jgi:organic radical activating enzyme
MPTGGCVLTGGEPLLQADQSLLDQLGARYAWVDIETNGTRPCPPRPANVFVSCSPKQVPNQALVVEPDWWKVLIPDQERFLDQALASGKPVFVQPTCPDAGPHGPAYLANIQRCLDLCYTRGCRISVQLHKYLGVE